MLLAPIVLALLGPGVAAAQAPATQVPAGQSAQVPITVQLMTVDDFPDVLAGQRIRVPRLEVERVLGPRLIVLWRPARIGIDRTSRESFTYDHLLVLLPARAELARRQVITVTGEVRRLDAARSAGLRLEDEATDKKALKRMPWPTTRLLLVADTVESEDGTLLVRAR